MAGIRARSSARSPRVNANHTIKMIATDTIPSATRAARGGSFPMPVNQLLNMKIKLMRPVELLSTAAGKQAFRNPPFRLSMTADASGAESLNCHPSVKHRRNYSCFPASLAIIKYVNIGNVDMRLPPQPGAAGGTEAPESCRRNLRY